jgi:hypothetical protein
MYPAPVAFLFVLHILGLFGYIPLLWLYRAGFLPSGVWMLDPTRLDERAPWEEIQLAYLLDVLCKKREGRRGVICLCFVRSWPGAQDSSVYGIPGPQSI